MCVVCVCVRARMYMCVCVCDLLVGNGDGEKLVEEAEARRHVPRVGDVGRRVRHLPPRTNYRVKRRLCLRCDKLSVTLSILAAHIGRRVRHLPPRTNYQSHYRYYQSHYRYYTFDILCHLHQPAARQAAISSAC